MGSNRLRESGMRGWMDGFLHSLEFSKSTADSNLYFKVVHNHILILVLYVDDLFLTSEEQLIEQCKRELTSEFEMKDLGLMHYFLGLEVRQKPGEIFLTQESMQRTSCRDLGCRTTSP